MTYYDDEYGEIYEPEPATPFVGERRYFKEEDGSMVEYEFTEGGEWVS